MHGFEIRTATAEEFAVAIEWAAGEGWNPGRDDLAAFHAADPDGFLIGMLDGAPVSSISVARYGKSYGFLGFYIVVPELRGQGYGIRTWQAGLAHLTGRTVGLDGVVAQQHNYRKSGFVLAGRNVRYTGTSSSGSTASDADIRAITADDLDAIADYDQAFFPDNRGAFIKQWSFAPAARNSRFGVVARIDDAIKGFGVVRACRNGFKIGPLFADDAAIAEAIYGTLCRELPPDSEVSLDVPEANAAAVDLAERADLAPSFETARMYRGGMPELPIARTFGITTFELG
jgi:Acetyltransferase (GNAT) domain/Acetyltransferase (GNAT) family